MNTVQASAPIVAQQLLLQGLPVSLAAVLMQQISRADRLFPAERRELDRTLKSLVPPRSQTAAETIDAFARLRLSPELQRFDWHSDPAGFVDRMTAELWSTGQIGTFRDAAKLLVPSGPATESETPNLMPRFVVIVFDRRLSATAETPILFRMLRPYGTFFPNAGDDSGMKNLERWIAALATKDPEPYGHWKVSGDIWNESPIASLASLSYNGLRASRQQLLAFFNTARNTAASGGPEGLRQALLRISPEQLGLGSIKDPVLRTFAMDIFTGGSGTQFYATTFVQWTIREVLRRAQPRSVLARFTPRSEATSIDLRISHPELEPALDGYGSLIDAEMGAYQSYLNLMRLPDAEHASFLVWHEGYGQALLIGNGMPRGAESHSVMTLERLVALTA